MRGEKKKRSFNTSNTKDIESEPLLDNDSQNDFTTIDLYDFSTEKCEFCDAVFYNKFNIMAHTASHIIIPLVRHKLHQCAKCNNYYPSSESLDLHALNDHLNITNKSDYMPDLLKSFIQKEPYAVLVKEEFTLRNNSEDVNNDLLNSFVTKQPVMMLTKEPLICEKETINGNSVLQSFVNNEAVTLLEPLDVKPDNVIDVSEDESSQASTNSKCCNQKSLKLKDRILFEDEDYEFNNLHTSFGDGRTIRSPELLHHLTNDCTVRINSLNGVEVRGSTEKRYKSNAIILGRYPCDYMGGSSVHYDDLVRSGRCRCKKCGKSFPNRYKSIVHEASHIKMKRRLPFLCRICDWYITNNRWDLQKHQQSKHPDMTATAHKTAVCKKCNLKYVNLYKHMRNYHKEYVCTVLECTSKFATKQEYFDHQAVHRRTIYDIHSGEETSGSHWNSRIVKVCSMCCSFFKSTAAYNYKFVNTLCEIGKRYNCERCEAKCFELNLVRLNVKKRKVRDESLRKNISNNERLKKLQRRFKNLKILNKY